MMSSTAMLNHLYASHMVPFSKVSQLYDIRIPLVMFYFILLCDFIVRLMYIKL